VTVLRIDIKKYEKPSSMMETLELLSKYGERARIIAGGVTLHELIERKLLRDVEVLIDIENMGLNYIMREDAQVRVGATCTISSLLRSLDSLRKIKQLNALYEACKAVKPLQVRNVATVGGELCSGISFFDLPTVLCSLNASLKIRSLRGERVVKIEEFFKGMFTVDISSDEVLEEVIIPFKEDAGLHTSFIKFGRTAQDYGLINVAVMMRFSHGNVCEDVRVFFGNVSDIPYRALEVEEALVGRPLSEESIEKAVNEVSRIEPMPTVHASPGYKKVLMKVLIRDLLHKILGERVEKT
jgi:CO/xanthine dehydrogenase FAD-binding subunit